MSSCYGGWSRWCLPPASSRARAAVVEGEVAPEAPRLDYPTLLARTFGHDVWACPCGGRRKVLAVITSHRAAEELLRKLGRLSCPPPAALAQGPPQLSLGV